MKFRKFAYFLILSTVLSTVVFLVVFFSYYTEITKFFFSFLPNEKNLVGSGDSEVSTVFSSYSDSYLNDPDLGIVGGVGAMNGYAEKLSKIFRTGSAENSNLDDIYDRFLVISKYDDGIEGRYLVDGVERKITLDCPYENNALFKNPNMIFVSANFNVLDEIVVGDILYSECIDPECTLVGPSCIVVRKTN